MGRSAICLFVLLIVAGSFGKAQVAQPIRGQVTNAATGLAVPFATLSVAEGELSSESNQEGYFLLNVPTALQSDSLTVSAINFRSVRLPLTPQSGSVLRIRLDSVATRGSEADTYFSLNRPFSARDTVLKALATLTRNYTDKPTLLRGFYRETIRQAQSDAYTMQAEGLIDLYKPPYYALKQAEQIRFIKGRRTPLTTLTIPVLTPGPWVGTMLDIVTYQNFLFRNGGVNKDYNFSLAGTTTLDGQLVHIVAFAPRTASVTTGYFTGTLFITAGNLALVRADYSLTPKGITVLNKSGYSQVYKTQLLTRTYVSTYAQFHGRWSLQSGRRFNTVLEYRSGVAYKARIDFVITQRQSDNVRPIKVSEQADFKTLPMRLLDKTDTTFWAGETILAPTSQVR